MTTPTEKVALSKPNVPCAGADLKKSTSKDPCKDSKKPTKTTGQTAMKNDAAKKVAQLKKDFPSLITQTFTNLTKGSAAKQLVVGSVAGWTTGFLTMKVSRTAAFGIGGSILLFQFAQDRGFVKTDWDKVKQKVDQTSKNFKVKYKYAEKSPLWKANIVRLARTHSVFTAGFVGGFLIGMAT